MNVTYVLLRPQVNIGALTPLLPSNSFGIDGIRALTAILEQNHSLTALFFSVHLQLVAVAKGRVGH